MNGHVSENCRKRQRPTEEDGPGGDGGVSVAWKEKKRKKQSKESLQEVAKLPSCEKKSQEKQTKKKNKNKKVEEPSKPAAVKEPVKNSKKVSAAPVKKHTVSSSESSSSSSSEEDVASKKPPAQKPANKTPPVSTPATSKTPPKTKPTSSSSSSETDEAPNVRSTQKTKPLASTSPDNTINRKSNCQQASSDQPSTNYGKQQEPHDSDGEEIKLFIHNPRQPPSWRGGGANVRGPKRGGPREKKARGGGRGFIRWQAEGTELSGEGAKEPSYHTDSLTNTSVVIQVSLHVSVPTVAMGHEFNLNVFSI